MDLNIRPETLKLMQERARNTLKHIGIGNDFLSRTQVAQQLTERTDKWNYMKLKSFCTKKGMVSKLKAYTQIGENPCQLFIRQELIIRIYRDLKKLISPQKSMTQ
jgi:hypothetical protein